MDEKKPAIPQKIADEQLENVTGGFELRRQDGNCYVYIGTDSKEDYNLRYLCPKCQGPVRSLSLGYYKCDHCNEKWFYESKLLINKDSNVWMEYVPVN